MVLPHIKQLKSLSILTYNVPEHFGHNELLSISFFILFGSSYGISSVLLKKNIRIHDPSYKDQIIATRVYRK